MSDEDSYSSQPPALEDAEIDDVSLSASIVSDSSDSCSISTEASEYSNGAGGGADHNPLGTPFVVPLKNEDDDPVRTSKVRDDALERNAMRRQSSSEKLGAMRAATRVAGEDQPRRRAPPRTKSGDGISDEKQPRRRPPPRTKSGEGVMSPRAEFRNQAEEDGDDGSSRGKEEILERNMARRQKSSEMLMAMRDATRKAPPRSKSSGAALQRRPPPRTTSGSVANLRKPPPRTKSGDGLGLRKPPARTKSGSVPKP